MIYFHVACCIILLYTYASVCYVMLVGLVVQTRIDQFFFIEGDYVPPPHSKHRILRRIDRFFTVELSNRRLDRDAAVLLVLARVGQALVARGLHGDDAGGGDERVGEGGFSC